MFRTSSLSTSRDCSTPEGVNFAHLGGSRAASSRPCRFLRTCGRTRRWHRSGRVSASRRRRPGGTWTRPSRSWAPGLHEALVSLGEGDFVIVDGTLIPTGRVAADEPYYSQKHKQHGMNIQVIARSDGTPLWFSRATPSRTHDLTPARAHGTVQARRTRQVLVLANRACPGAGATVRTPDSRPPRPGRALSVVQPGPCPSACPRRTRLRPHEAVATAPASTLLNPTDRPHRPSRPHFLDLPIRRMKEVQ